jgi:amino acid adenylation domain-containing protein
MNCNHDLTGQATTLATAATHSALAAIWAEMLEVPASALGPASNFFAQGGDSLAAARLLARLEETCGAALSLEDLFAAPTLAELAALVEAAAGGGAPPPLPRLPEGPAPLSFTQRRLWFLHRLDPGNPVHNIAGGVRIEGCLDPAALAAALREIVRRHEPLRTRFAAATAAAAGGEPTQVVAPPPSGVSLPVLDLAALPPHRAAAEATRLATALGRIPFDLDAGRLLRCALLRRGPDRGELVVALHHIAADGGSLAVLLRELAALCAAGAGRRPPSAADLPALPARYRDFAAWQRQTLRGEALAPLLAFWRQRLAGAPAALELPADRPRPPVLSHRGAHREALLPRSLAAAVEALARRAGATPFMAVLAAFAALLCRYTGQEDLVLGAPISGRTRAEVEGLIGAFINNLALRLDTGGDPDFDRLLARVRQTALTAYAHQDLPFELLVDELGGVRDRSRTPVFQVLLVWQNAPLQPVRLPLAPPVTLLPRELDLGTARFDLALSAAPLGGGLSLTFKYSADLFDAPTVERLAVHLRNLLAAAVATPWLPLSQLPLLAAAERHQLLLGWNDTRAAIDGDLGLYPLFAAQAARTPASPALVDGALALGYGALDRRVRRLGRRLRALGVGPESVVGIAIERSAAMVIAALAVLEAGGAYLPLDPDYPGERLAFMVRDSGARLLLTTRATRPRLGAALAAAGTAAWLDVDVDVDVESEGPEAMGRRAGAADVQPLGAAYVIYTSGSTGRPKGVVIPHLGIVNRLAWMQRAYGLGDGDRVLQKTPFSFDVSVWEIFWPLLTGARLVMAPPGAHRDAGRLAALIAEHGITTVHFVPSMLQAFLDTPGAAERCGSLRRVIASGEALSYGLKERCRAALAADLHNLYGPTEASVDVTFAPCAPGPGPGGRREVPIGRPIANTRIHLLDRGGRPVPAGVAGELCIGGIGLARGYLGRPDLTAERFVPDALGGMGERLYRTGDLARHRHDGAIEFLGRLDHQVKVRGFRIELREIEAALERHPAVREAVALLRHDEDDEGGEGDEGGESSEPRLVACVTLASSLAAPAGAELRAFLAASLPGPMIPAVFVFLPEIPLGASGKVDRKALARLTAEAASPAAAAAATAADASRAVPRTPLERRLAALWEEVLGGAAVARDDDFFELGGDSIQAAMLANRLQHELGEVVHVMSLFDAPTVARLAELLRRRYPETVGRLAVEPATTAGGTSSPAVAGSASVAAGSAAAAPPANEVGEAAVVALRAAVARRLRRRAPLAAAPPPSAPRNRAAVFILSPFRSGSTLLRVMLAGHSRLFAPPELELLAFATMGERRDAYSGRDGFAAEGLLRAVMELTGGDVGSAGEVIAGAESEDLPVERFYARLQEWIGPRLLVDKTPSYALDLDTLRRAEALFAEPLYVHLVRHPAATIHSYVDARMDQVYGFPLPPREQAEAVWRLAHRNILALLAEVPAQRQLRLRYEDLVRAPREEMTRLGGFLGVGFEPAMLEPYRGRRMTDGPHARSRMMGDPRFHLHQDIDPGAADRWRREPGGAGLARLAPASRELAARLGYADALAATDAAEAADAAAADAAAASATAGNAAAADAEAALGPRPEPRREGEELPVSFAQERLWFLAQLDPANPAYNMPAAVRCQGALDLPALAASCAELVRRHEALRTAFRNASGRPAAIVEPPSRLPLPVADLAVLPPARRDAERLRLAGDEGRRPFGLDRGPRLRLSLLRLAPDEHVLLITLHHLAADGWSIGILVRELAALYRAAIQGAPSPLPELPLQYADYAAWQRRRLTAAALDEHLAYWRRRLAGPLPALELPTDRPRPALMSMRGARRSATLPPAAVAAVREWGLRQDMTLFVALLAAWTSLLHRYTGQEDLLAGVPVANRDRLEIEGLIGLFLNMVAQRTAVAGDLAFGDLARRVKDGFLASLPHQAVPFEKVVEAVAPQRDRSRAPIFQVQLSLQNTPAEALALPGLALSRLDVHNGTTKFDLTVFLFDEPEGLVTTLEYATDLFDGATVERLLGHWHTHLLAAVADAGSRVADLPLLADAERTQLLAGWNGGGLGAELAPGPGRLSGAPFDGCLHELFARQAALSPAAVAVVCDLETLRYGELDRRSDLVARQLRELGAGPEVPVGLCAERSLAMVVGMLGILKAGGAYVPLDPAYPGERLTFILDDALAGSGGAPLLVAQAPLAAALPAAAGCRLLLLDSGGRVQGAAGAAASPPADAAAAAASPANLAYVLYTSGSTGRPKGVGVTHANVVRLLAVTASELGFGAADVWTLFHSFAFDFSVWEIWGALAFGGRLVVVPREVARSPSAFHELLATERVTVLNQTPSAFRQLVRLEQDEGGLPLPALRLVVFGGEALDPGALTPWIARHGDRRPELVNMYGITETTVHVTRRWIRAADASRAGRSPIGAPLADLAAHLLGPSQELVPLGVTGEIHVGGAGLARGYLGRPDLTAARFVPDPFAAAPGARLYRSGDLARRLPGGELEYLGRRDAQVKVRGFRIELGEIEAALAGHPEVREAVVVAHPDVGDGAGNRLAAYVVPAAAAAPPAAASLREHLRLSLPEHMVPAAFVTLSRLPLTPSGKIDRRALPDSATAAATGGGEEPAVPLTATERRLAATWRELLRLDGVSGDDNFFDAGGHSLLVTQLVARVRTVFGVELPMAAVFEAPTLRALAGRLDALLPAAAARSLPPPTPRPRPAALAPLAAGATAGAQEDVALPLSYAQERLWFLDRLEPGSALYNIPLALALSGPLAVPALAWALGRLLRRHAALRTRFAAVDGSPLQVVVPLAGLALPVVDLAALPATAAARESARLTSDEGATGFDLGAAPLLRTRLLRRSAVDHTLLLTLHHIAGDGWSLGILIRELGALYGGAAAGHEAVLAPLPVDYADYAVWQRGWLRGEALASHLDYWRHQLAGAPSGIDLPLDHPRPPVPSGRGGSCRLELDGDLVRRLRRRCRDSGTTPFMTLLAAFAGLLERYSGQRDLVVGTPTANRGWAEIEPLVGFFANNLVLRLDLAAEPSLLELLAQVRATVLAGFAHQEVPFEKLVEDLLSGRDLSRSPLFQVVFACAEQEPVSVLPGLAAELLPLPRAVAKFDLDLGVELAGEAAAAVLVYNRDLFEDATAERLLRHFAVLAGAALREPSRPLSELPLATPAERRQLLAASRTAPAALPAPWRQVAGHLAARAAAAPLAVAVEHRGRTLTFGELDRRANQLARRLRSAGVGPEVPVAVALERGVEQVAALFGVLRAGGVYTPLDPASPPERLAQLLADARAPVLVAAAAARSAAVAAAQGVRTVVVLDADWSGVAGERDDDPGVAVDPRQAAYVIYTSGSTGRPKGVTVEHGALASHAACCLALYGLGPSDRVLQFAAASFDVSIEEIVPTLLAGACLVLRDDAMVASATAFLAACGELALTVASLPTAFWHELCRELAGAAPLPRALRLVLISGEQALPERLAEWRRRAPGRPLLLNTYGLTEATILSTAGDLGSVDGAGASGASGDLGARPAAAVPIGLPVAGTEVLLLDRAGEPLPPGPRGEIHVGGALLARGYLGMPDATAARFLPHPFAAEPGARLFRTGDLGRRLAGGELQFVGRGDRQVKVRGHRIELGEIEAALAAHPGIAAAAVVAPLEASGQRRLVAYVAPAASPGPAEAELRAHLRARLPEPLLPSVLVYLDALPLSAHGKLDRAALPAPPAGRPAASPLPAPPRDEVERRLAAIWQEALGVDRLSVHDNFFDLGGHSLLMIRVNERLQESFGRSLPLLELFQHPTIAALALHLQATAADVAPAPGLAGAGGGAIAARAARSRAAAREARFLRARRGGRLMDTAAMEENVE